MPLLNTYQLYPKKTIFLLNSSITKLHFFRYFSSKNHFLCGRFDNVHSNPSKRFNLLLENEHKAVNLSNCNVISVSFCSYSGSRGSRGSRGSDDSWLGKWRGIYKGGRSKQPEVVLDYRYYGYASNSDGEDNNGSRTDVRGSTMKSIVDKLRRYGYVEDIGEGEEEGRRVIEKGSIEDIFYVEEGMLPNSRGGFCSETPLGDETVFGRRGDYGFPWEKREIRRMFTVRPKTRFSSAEATLHEFKLRRLKKLALEIKSKTKTKSMTRITTKRVTHEIVDKINEKWKSSEVVALRVKGLPARNMKRIHTKLERKTGGLVIWRRGPFVFLYRGINYKSPSEISNKRSFQKDFTPCKKVSAISEGTSDLAIRYNASNDSYTTQADSSCIVEEEKGVSQVSYEDEIEHLLARLGPRYIDWPGSGPLPVDACLLPRVVPGYQPPFRLLPYGVRSTLADKEATTLKRLARVLPPHFAVGRCREHQGLATAMVKLWARSSVAKIAFKVGVELTSTKRIAEDIKKMTGAILLSRNKYFMVFYRGKDFLRPDVAEALLEKGRLVNSLQDKEGQARLRTSSSVTKNVRTADEVRISAGTLGETLDADARWGEKLDEDKDPQNISDEDRFMLRRLGLRMKAFLIFGRPGVFYVTVENMHLHWKYRQLIKIIVKGKNFAHVKNIAILLEAESGGVLVSVDKVSKGYAIIVYRGKDYKRPLTLRPRTLLLTKRKALARSIELQGREDSGLCSF